MNAGAARIRAQAKINLRLRVLAREPSGYHQIETIFARVELADDVRVRTAVRGRTLDCRGSDVGPVEQNLAWRAAMALRDAGGPDSFGIEIEKRIPVGGGLGGGSADAGAVLRTLNALSNRPLSDEHLMSLAFSLGADVPFLTTTHPFALGRGRGERLLGLPALPSVTVWLAIPSFGVNTAEAYGWLAELRGDAPPDHGELVMPSLTSWRSIAPLAVNDFEPVVEARHPELGRIREAFRDAGARVALLAGSGSTVLGVFDDASAADALDASSFEALGARLLQTRTAESVSPVIVD